MRGRSNLTIMAGTDVIYQATSFDGTWRGHADFLRKVDTPNKLGDFSYEIWDTKLARRAKAAAVLQVFAYSEQVEKLQAVHPVAAHRTAQEVKPLPTCENG
jgi:predicted RecB family nuclease